MSLGPTPLSNREREIIGLLAHGLTGEQIAQRLVLSSETVKTHVRNAMGKLGANTRGHAIAIAVHEGYVEGPRRPVPQQRDMRPSWTLAARR